MPVVGVTRPLRILRRDSGDAVIALAGTLDSQSAPCSGFSTLSIFCRFGDTGVLEVYQRLRSESTMRVTDTFNSVGASTLRTTVNVTGENIRVLFTATAAQSPELVCTLE